MKTDTRTRRLIRAAVAAAQPSVSAPRPHPDPAQPGQVGSSLSTRPLARSVGLTVAAAVLGNGLVGKDAMAWYRDLRRPRMQIPLPASIAVGAVYYLCIGRVLHRSILRGDRTAYRLALVVLAGNEAWNAVFFGRHSTRNGFLGVLAFAVPVCLLQARIADDRASALALSPYTAWVLAYDVPWTYRLWRLNPRRLP